jgi:hypothetical protein
MARKACLYTFPSHLTSPHLTSPHLTSPHLTSTRLASHIHFPPSLQYPNLAHHTTPHTPSRRTVPRTTPSSTPPVIHRSSNLASPCFACPCTRLPADRPRNSPRLKRQGRGGVFFGCLHVVIGCVWRRGGDWLHESARTCGVRGRWSVWGEVWRVELGGEMGISGWGWDGKRRLKCGGTQ